MSGAILLLPLYAFMAWIRKTWDFEFLRITHFICISHILEKGVLVMHSMICMYKTAYEYPCHTQDSNSKSQNLFNVRQHPQLKSALPDLASGFCKLWKYYHYSVQRIWRYTGKTGVPGQFGAMVRDGGGSMCGNSSQKARLPSETGCSPFLAHLGHCRDQSPSWHDYLLRTFVWWVIVILSTRCTSQIAYKMLLCDEYLPKKKQNCTVAIHIRNKLYYWNISHTSKFNVYSVTICPALQVTKYGTSNHCEMKYNDCKFTFSSLKHDTKIIEA